MPDVDYSRGNYAALPSDDTDLEFIFNGNEYQDVKYEDNVYVAQTAYTQNAVFLFKKQFTDDVSAPTATWIGRTTLAPSSSTVYLQVYNRTSGLWETVDSDNTTAADTKFTLTAVISHGLSNYFDINNFIAFRVYQLDA